MLWKFTTMWELNNTVLTRNELKKQKQKQKLENNLR